MSLIKMNIKLNKNEVIKLYDLAIDDRDTFYIIQDSSNGIGYETKVIVKSLNNDKEYDITDYDCW